MEKPSGDSARADSGKAKALFLSPEAPYPAVGGGPLRSASLLQYLSQHFAVHAIIFRQPGDVHPAGAIPAGMVERVDVIELPYHARSSVARVARNTARYVRGAPPLTDRFAGFGDDIARIVQGHRYDLGIVEHFWCAPYYEQIRPHAKSIVLDLHNIESAWHGSVASVERGAKAVALRRFATASVALERKWLPRFDNILVTSAADAAIVAELAPNAKVAVYPNALPEIPQPPRQDEETIVFSGNLEYAPNIAAVDFFSRQVWPALQQRWPNLRWRIVGKNPHAVEKLVHGRENIVLAGPIDDAVRELAQARAAVVPILSGSGTRIKILEAWAAGTPVVSTSIGAAGLEARNGEHLLIADGADQLVEAISGLLTSEGERRRIGSAGRALYEQRYTWPVAWQILGQILGNNPGNASPPEKV